MDIPTTKEARPKPKPATTEEVKPPTAHPSPPPPTAVHAMAPARPGAPLLEGLSPTVSGLRATVGSQHHQ